MPRVTGDSRVPEPPARMIPFIEPGLPSAAVSLRRITEVSVVPPVVVERMTDDLSGLVRRVEMRDLRPPGLGAGHVLVAQEVVAEALHEGDRTVRDVAKVPVCGIPLEDGQDLVVRLLAVEHAKAPDRSRGDED